MIFITGDIHGSIDIHKFSKKAFPLQRKLTRSDYMIICGDFGLLWDNSPSEKYWIKWLNKKPWTTLWIDGNHENYDLIKKYPTENWNGGKVQKISEHILHLCRGSVFNIDGTKIFAFGGAESHDKAYRKPGVSIWDEEMPNSDEMESGIQSLDKAEWNVDIVLTHTLPESIQQDIFKFYDYPCNALTSYLDKINKKLKFEYWFSGHYHVSYNYDNTHFLVYNDIIHLTQNTPDAK